jgi:hypothetical protein
MAVTVRRSGHALGPLLGRVEPYDNPNHGRPEYRGTASGFAYIFVKLPSFLAIFLFPSLFTAIGQTAATLFVAIFPLIGLLAAIFILPEVYGYEHDSEPTLPLGSSDAGLTAEARG